MNDRPGLEVRDITVSFPAPSARASRDSAPRARVSRDSVPRDPGSGNPALDGSVVVLDRVSLAVPSGSVVALLGPSGSGKSTLLRVIAGIMAPDSGRVLVNGVDVTTTATHRRGIGMVFQDNQLFPHLTTQENVAFGPKMAKMPRAAQHERAATWLRRVGLAGFEHRAVTELSGGEAKRVALARTLAAEPEVVLLDEPLTGLDRELHDRLAGELGELLRTTHTTALLVTHDRDEAATIAQRTVQLADL